MLKQHTDQCHRSPLIIQGVTRERPFLQSAPPFSLCFTHGLFVSFSEELSTAKEGRWREGRAGWRNQHENLQFRTGLIRQNIFITKPHETLRILRMSHRRTTPTHDTCHAPQRLCVLQSHSLQACAQREWAVPRHQENGCLRHGPKKTAETRGVLPTTTKRWLRKQRSDVARVRKPKAWVAINSDFFE